MMTSFVGGVGNLSFYQITRPHNTEGHYIHTLLPRGCSVNVGFEKCE
jgi:hypothetical protein